jgi:tRNA-2-methylthio-N6-dimethylallyladenosine synthase
MEIRTYRVETWGCQMNVLDSQRLEGVLRGRGLVAADTADSADLVLLNTCAVREKAVQKIVSRLGELRALQQRTGLPRHVGLCGCVAEQEGTDFLDRLSVVSFVLGPGQIAGLGGALDVIASGERPALLGTAPGGSYQAAAIARTDSRRQFVTVMHGCDQHCTYCVVPLARGREVGRPLADIVAEVRDLAAAGVLEVTLLGQTINAYRCPSTGADLADLLEAVTGVDGLWRVQVVTSHPRFFDEKLIRALGTLPRLATMLHMPCQAGADRTLKRMGRRYTRQQYLDLVGEIRAAAPQLTLSTDVIVGFPGETEEEFLETVDLVSRVRFGQLYGFVFSPRQGTGAARLEGRVPRAEAGERLNRLFAVQGAIQLDLNRALVGQTVEILVDGPAKRGAALWHGRGADNRVVNFPAWDSIRAGVLASVTVTGATAHALMGDRTENPVGP